MPIKKFPPPPFMTGEMQSLNRWLIELQNILNAGGSINPDDVDGLPALIVEVALLSIQVFSLTGQVSALTGQVTTLQGDVTTLQARNQVYNGAGAPAPALGIDGDWYGDPAGAVGARIWIKIAGVWTAFPF